jgi:hypothetical protein
MQRNASAAAAGRARSVSVVARTAVKTPKSTTKVATTKVRVHTL